LHDDFIKEAINQIHITFEPWKDYEPIFTFLSEILKDSNWCYLDVENGKIVKIRGKQLPNKIWLRDFLIKIYPIISVGIVKPYPSQITNLSFHPFAREWVSKVIENEGKT
jgi:hypothetical protein